MGWRIGTGALLVAVACSGGDTPVDAGAADVGLDAGTRDADRDASDGGTDADSRVDPGWVRLPGFPDDCYVERARRPDAVLAFHWEACRDAVSQCQMIAIDRAVAGVAPLQPPGGASRGNDARGALAWTLLDAASAVQIEALTRQETVVAAWRAGPFTNHVGCDVSAFAGADGVGIDAYWVGNRMSGDRISTASWSDLVALDSPAWTGIPPLFATGDFLEAPSTSATTYAAMTTTSLIVAVEPPRAAVVGNGAEPVVVGHSVLFNWGDASGATGIHLSRLGGREVELYRAPAGTHVYGVRADGQWIVWFAGTDDPTGTSFPLNELWTAPYAETGPLSARRLYSDLESVAGFNGNNGTIGDGMFAYQGGDVSQTHGGMHVVDLATGARRVYYTPGVVGSTSGLFWSGDAAWVTRDEVAIPANWGTGMPTVVRIALTAFDTQPSSDAGTLDAGAMDGGLDTRP